MGTQAYYKGGFNGGELSPLFEGRIDHVKYPLGLSKSRNAIPSVHGAATRRPGTKFVAVRAGGAPSVEAVGIQRTRETASVLIPHVLDADNAYLYEFNGTRYAGVYKNRSLSSSFNHPFPILPRRPDWTSKLSTVQQGSRLFMATSGDSPLIEIQNDGSTVAAAYAWENTPEVYAEKLSREHATYFASNFNTPPFQDYEDGKPVLFCETASGRTGDAKLNNIIWAPEGTFPQGCVGMRMVFNPDIKDLVDVRVWTASTPFACYDFMYNGGRVYQAYHEAGSVAKFPTEPVHTFGAWHPSRIVNSPGAQVWKASVGYVGNGHFSCQIAEKAKTDPGRPGEEYVIVKWDHTNAPQFRTSRWAWAAVATGPTPEPGAAFPSNVSIYRGRLVVSAGTRLYFSQPGRYLNFNQYDPNGTITADCSVSVDIPSRQNVAVDWLVGQDELLIGSKTGIYSCQEDSQQAAFGPGNARIDLVSSNGSHNVEPAVVDDEVFYVLRGGKRLLRLIYENGGWKTSDLSVLADHIPAAGIKEIVWQDEPYKALWMTMGDGRLIGMTWNREQDVWAWHPHASDADDHFCGLACIPSPSGEIDDVWMVTARRDTNYSGVLKYRHAVEYMADAHKIGGDTRTAIYSDCSLEYHGLVESPAPSYLQTTTAPAGDGSWTETDVVMVRNVKPFGIALDLFTSADVGDVIRLLATDPLAVPPAPDYSAPFADLEILVLSDAKTVFCRPLGYVDESLRDGTAFYQMRRSRIPVGLAISPGREVTVTVDGCAHANAEVQGEGENAFVEVSGKFSDIIVGIPCNMVLRPMRIEAGGDVGTSQGKIKKIDHVTLRLLETSTCKVGRSEDALDVVDIRTPSMRMNRPVEAYTGDRKIAFNGGNSPDGYVVIVADQALPFTLISMVIDVDMGS